MTTLERAFELANGGACEDVRALREQLMREGYDHNQLQGPSLIKQLRRICTDRFVEQAAEK